MEVAYFTKHRPGPEVVIEKAVADRLEDFVSSEDKTVMAVGSPRIGGGLPDLIVVSCEQEVFALAHIEMPSTEILAYLRAVRHASVDTIAKRVGRPKSVIVRCIDELVEVEAIQGGNNAFSLNQNWREILPEIVTIEAKVEKWRDAVTQAARNRLFAHKSYIALPSKIADRVRNESVIMNFGLGILAVGDSGEVRVVRNPRKTRPRIWTYYYKLASLLAAQHRGQYGGFCRRA